MNILSHIRGIAFRSPFFLCVTFSSLLLNAEGVESERPEPIRFVKTALSTGEFYEPTEMTILPNLDVLIVQRRGEILHYSQEDESVYRVGFLDAYFESEVNGVNAEEGVLGLVADPNFAENNFIYIFYSPRDKVVNRLSRFVFKDRVLDMDSETVVLEFFSQRDICCHTGGSLAFGPDGLLYLSTGDNSTPFDEEGAEYRTEGFGPLNDLPGKEQFDARRSSANTNDLRGKILRIRPMPDGTYEIPEGNLFPATDKTRPEIYTMGHRNPYRISVDRKTGTLHWGDIGPDANEDSAERGPRGYDEMNRATEAGNFGWPLFVGNSSPYRDYDYGTGESGDYFDPAKPINDSANNTGLKELPPSRPPFIWYPYLESEEFPLMGSGGRNAMAGPVYNKEFYPEDTRLVDYYDGKLVLYDFMRNLFVAVQLGPDGEFLSMERILENLKFSAPIDVELGPDGRLYVLEYGSGWYLRNEDSGLSRIDFIEGNLPPQIASISLEKRSGKEPFALAASAQVSDPEGDAMTYRWSIGSKTTETASPEFEGVIAEPGPYSLVLTVEDEGGSTSVSEPIDLYVGNDQPNVSISIKGNQSFHFPKVPFLRMMAEGLEASSEPVSYRVEVEDDTEVVQGNIRVTTELVDMVQSSNQGHQIISREDQGKAIMAMSDCRACHKESEASIGPSYAQIADRYAGESTAEAHLSNKILQGGAGVWGEVPMPAHPSLSESDVLKVVAYIRSFAEGDGLEATLPARGEIDPWEQFSDPGRQIFVLKASYTDVPGGELQPLTGETSLSLYPSTMVRYWFTDIEGMEENVHYLDFTQKTAGFVVPKINLKEIRGVAILQEFSEAQAGTIRIRVGRADGEVIGKGRFSEGSETYLKVRPGAAKRGFHDLYFSFEFEEAPKPGTQFQLIEFRKSRN